MLNSEGSFDENDRTELRFKFLVLGEVASGKTSFIHRYVDNMFTASYKPTIGVDFAMKTLQWNATTSIKLQLWDISGHSSLLSSTRVYYQNTAGALIMFDLSCKDSFAAVIQWKRDLDEKVVLPNGQPVPCLLIGNKCDLMDKIDNWDDLDNFCKDNKFSGFFFASAKTGANVNESIHCLVEQVLENDELNSILQRKKFKTSIQLAEDESYESCKNKKTNSCC